VGAWAQLVPAGKRILATDFAPVNIEFPMGRYGRHHLESLSTMKEDWDGGEESGGGRFRGVAVEVFSQAFRGLPPGTGHQFEDDLGWPFRFKRVRGPWAGDRVVGPRTKKFYWGMDGTSTGKGNRILLVVSVSPLGAGPTGGGGGCLPVDETNGSFSGSPPNLPARPVVFCAST